MPDIEPHDRHTPDPVKWWLDRVNAVLADQPLGRESVEGLLEDLESFSPRELVRFDEQARPYLSGLDWSKIPKLDAGGEIVAAPRRAWARITSWSPEGPASVDAASSGDSELWRALAMVSGDGYQRERAVRSLRLRPLTVRLVALRCVDWVAEVRDAALDRLVGCESRLLVAALPLAEQLARERVRGKILSSLLDASLPDEDLRHAYRLSDPRTRRAAWRRLRARGVTTADELSGVAARDPDVVVRGIAASALMHLSGADKRFLAGVLVNDRVGSVAIPALAALVELDGAQPIHAALTGRSPSLRRAARDWAAIRGVDARGVYLQRLADDHRDAIALTALAEMGDPQDVELFKQMLAGDRSRVRAAGLRALARIDRSAGRRTALTALQAGTNGRMTWTAADVLGDGRLSDTELRAIAGVATDSTRTPGQRFRALSLLRGSPWVHLAALLQARQDGGDENFHRRLDREVRVWISRSGKVSRGPHPALRTQIEQLVNTIDAQARTEIEFVLRTTQ